MATSSTPSIPPASAVHQVYEAYETYGYPGQGPYLITCEHASCRIPSPLRTDASDRAWLGTHWGWDIGARTVARELVRSSGSHSVMARFSRLVCDPNRDPVAGDFLRRRVEGIPLSFNMNVDQEEISRRLSLYHEPFHSAVDAGLRARLNTLGDVLLLSIHSFTPVFDHRLRTMDMGVLFNPYEAVALRLKTELEAEGFVTALNEPYSALNGMAYSVERHGTEHDVIYLELEVNQALICTPGRARKVARRLGDALSRLKLRTEER
jgi:predicted N-formylglutamate amidohydrolase